MTMLRFLPLMIAAAILSVIDRASWAEVQVSGRPDAVHLEARGASLHDVLAALHDRFNLRYRANDPLEMQMTGIFDGPLSRVAARVLDGYDYAMRITSEGIDVLVLGRHSTSVDVAVAPASAPRPPLTAAERKHFEHGHLR
ncbi:hypothetical protein [Bradyrhizobium neotropicale]|uniref:Uncharacterized protein n=1 Tax=Bradyrhizobium neotropicale TaxID=1497615 RepID=A0A176ZCW5_9BRAD|nr:hypothetical protein [Bradyrhizobium neotropicale]OAF18491.1 hypothetical protein AXW67_02930 [Bradyrhizobium neotropicale]